MYFHKTKTKLARIFKLIQLLFTTQYCPFHDISQYLSQVWQSIMDILSPAKDIPKDIEKHDTHAWTDDITSVDVATITNLCNVECEAAQLPDTALLPHHVHHQHVPNLPVGVADIPCSAISPGDEEMFLPLLPLSDAHVRAALPHPLLAGGEHHVPPGRVGTPHVQAVWHQAGGAGGSTGRENVRLYGKGEITLLHGHRKQTRKRTARGLTT